MAIDPTDSILMDENLTEQDREAMIALATANRSKKNNNIFDNVRERENVEKLDYAIKAVLEHLIKSRGGIDGNRAGA